MIHITKHLYLSISMDTSLCNKNLCFFIINNIPLLPSDFFFTPPPLFPGRGYVKQSEIAYRMKQKFFTYIINTC